MTAAEAWVTLEYLGEYNKPVDLERGVLLVAQQVMIRAFDYPNDSKICRHTSVTVQVTVQLLTFHVC